MPSTASPPGSKHLAPDNDGALDAAESGALAEEGDWREHFADPPAAFRPVPFWSWNEWMEPAEVARQVLVMKEGGWGGAFIHARIGLLTPYLGEEWFRACQATLDACRQNGLIAWLYDEDKWPSGFSGGSVPLANPDFRHKALISRPSDRPAPPNCTPLGEPQNGVQAYRWLSPLGDPWFNGTTYADLLSKEAMQKFLHDAYAPYHARFSEEYGPLIVAQFTDEPCSSYRSRLPQGAIPFTDELPQAFERMHGYAPGPRLHLLFGAGQAGENAERFRLHYFQTVAHLFEHNFSAQLGAWCESHSIALTGHYILEGSLYEQMLWGTQIMPHYRHQGIPGVDLLGRQIEERITAKQCHSVANQYGKKRVLSELYGVAGGGLTFEDRWWIACQQICLGVNVLNPHLSLYTMAGCRKRDYPANLFYQQPWWEQNRAVDEPLSRLCVALSQGKFHAEFLVLHPAQSAFVLWQAVQGDGREKIGSDWKPVTASAQARVNELDRDFKALTDALLGAQRTFDYADETILAQDAGVEDGRLRVGEMSYAAVLLPSMETIAATTLQVLQGFQSAGGTVLRCGQAPRLLDGEPSARLDGWLASLPFAEPQNWRAAWQGALAPQVSAPHLEAEDVRLLWTHVRDLENGERLVFLTNLSRHRDFEAQVLVRGAWGAAWEMDSSSGQERALTLHGTPEGASLQLSFARTQGHLLRLSPAPLNNDYGNGDRNGANGHQVLAVTEPRAVELAAGEWRVERLDDNALTLDCALWKTGASTWSERAMPLIAIQEMLNRTRYSGPLWLRFEAQVGTMSPARQVRLVVERPENYQIRVNDEPVEHRGLPFWRDIRWLPIDISGMLGPGSNEVELFCADFHFGDLAEILDQPARYGTEIEAVYLTGDFSVRGELTGEAPVQDVWQQWELPPIGVRCFAGVGFVLDEPRPLALGDATVQGCPFYAGRIRLTATLPELASARRVRLRLEHLDGAVAQLALDDEPLGTIWAHPLEIELPEGSGGREISITLFGTLRNLLGPHHHAAGELCQVGPEHFKPGPPPEAGASGEGYAGWLQRWAAREVEPANWNDRYCMISFGEVGSVVLLCE